MPGGLSSPGQGARPRALVPGAAGAGTVCTVTVATLCVVVRLLR